MLIVSNLSVAISEIALLDSVSLSLQPGQVHICMGPNGSGKSSLAYALMGHPKYQITQGLIELNGVDVTHDTPDKRARSGMFLSLQQPYEIPGVTLGSLLKESFYAIYGPDELDLYLDRLTQGLKLLKMNGDFLQRGVHQGLSGGEKKRCEMLQLLVLQPKIAILDEIDSGLDVDALKLVGTALQIFKKMSPNSSLFLITHYSHVAQMVIPDVVHVLQRGTIVKTGGNELISEIERYGYEVP